MDDHAGLGGQFSDRHFPGLGRVGEQHLARLMTGEPHLLVIAGDRVAADSLLLVVELRIAVKLGVGLRLDDANLAPVGVEILGEDQPERRAGALPHFGGRAGDGADAVFADGHEGADIQRTRGERGRDAVRAERDGDGGGSGSDQEAAAGKRRRFKMVCHGQPLAAVSMAAMIAL